MFAVPQNLPLVRHPRIANAQAQHEPIQLRLWQRVSAVMLDRVLGRQHNERCRQRVSHAFDRHLPFGHCLQQRRLRLGRRAIDLIGQDDVSEDWTGLPLEARLVLIVNGQADNI